jgi:hypothetical protein
MMVGNENGGSRSAHRSRNKTQNRLDTSLIQAERPFNEAYDTNDKLTIEQQAYKSRDPVCDWDVNAPVASLTLQTYADSAKATAKDATGDANAPVASLTLALALPLAQAKLEPALRNA